MLQLEFSDNPDNDRLKAGLYVKNNSKSKWHARTPTQWCMFPRLLLDRDWYADVRKDSPLEIGVPFFRSCETRAQKTGCYRRQCQGSAPVPSHDQPRPQKTKDNSLKSLQVGREKWTVYKHYTVEDRQRIFINSFLVFRLLKPIVNVPIQGDLWFSHDRYYVRPSSHRWSLGCS